MKIKYFILTLLLFAIGKAFAQDVKFTASVSKTEVGTGEQFQVDFTVNGNASSYTPPNFGGFQVLSGPNESTSMTSINGVTTETISLSYILMGIKEGEFTIGAATVIANGRRLTTNPIKIKVVKGRAVPQNSQAQSGGGDNVPAASAANLSKSLFMRAVVDKTTVYQGEQLTLNYRLYTRVNIESYQVDNSAGNGFWNEDIKSSAATGANAR